MTDYSTPESIAISLDGEITDEIATAIAEKIGLDLNKYSLEEFKKGLKVELEHGTINKATNVTNDNPLMTGKIALAHLNEFADYYKSE